jgi:hypothetical protein
LISGEGAMTEKECALTSISHEWPRRLSVEIIDGYVFGFAAAGSK